MKGCPTRIYSEGAELFTSDITFMLAAWVEGKVKFRSVIWNIVWCWFGNLCGSLWMVQLYLWSEVFNGKEAFEQAVSIKKTSLGFGVAFVRGMLCNWLVNIGVWQAMSAQDITGKFVGVFIPITIFFASGFEHVIANQFAIPIGIRFDSGVTVNYAITANFIPVTLGNMCSAALMVVAVYYCTIGSGHNKFVNWWNEQIEKFLPHPLASWLQTGDVVRVGDDLHPLPSKFVGDRSIIIGNSITKAGHHKNHLNHHQDHDDTSHKGMLYKLRDVATSLLHYHGHHHDDHGHHSLENTNGRSQLQTPLPGNSEVRKPEPPLNDPRGAPVVTVTKI